MSYCYVWKKGGRVYLLAESAFSSRAGSVGGAFSAFGEAQGQHGAYYVEEGQLKLFQIDAQTAVAFAGNVEHALEVIRQIYDSRDTLSFEMIQDILQANGSADTEFALVRGGDTPAIFHFDGLGKRAVSACELGSGGEDSSFSDSVKAVTEQLYRENGDENHYLACVIGCVQCYSLKKHSMRRGYGGTYYGAVMGKKLQWFRDLEYYLFREDIRQGQTISVIQRGSSVFSASDITETSTFMLHSPADGYWMEDPGRIRGILKSLDTKNAFYYFFYSPVYNCVLFMIARGESQNLRFRRWMRRGEDQVYYAYAFDPQLQELMQKAADPAPDIPRVLYLPSVQAPYCFHEDIGELCDPGDILKAPPPGKMDYDFDRDFLGKRVPVFRDYDVSLLQEVKRRIGQYRTLLLADFAYFCNAIEEKVRLYAPFREMDIRELDLRQLLSPISHSLAHGDFESCLLVFYRSGEEGICIQGQDMQEMFLQYPNCLFLSSRGPFQAALHHLLRQYYINDRFFHLGNFLIAADSEEVDALLRFVLPEYHFSAEQPEIILLRNLNCDTRMTVQLKYCPMESLVVHMFGITAPEFYELEALADTQTWPEEE